MENKMPVYKILALAIGSRDRCYQKGNAEWCNIWNGVINQVCADLPSGSGFDSGSKLDNDSHPEKLIFTTSFHHMNDCGMYDGWTDHTITVKPSLLTGFTVSVSGKNRNDIKEYIAQAFDYFLDQELDQSVLIQTAKDSQ